MDEANSTPEQRQIEELWHNLYRMHSYVEAACGHPAGDQRPPILRNADMLLRSSFSRVQQTLPDTRCLEQPPSIPGLAEPVSGSHA